MGDRRQLSAPPGQAGSECDDQATWNRNDRRPDWRRFVNLASVQTRAACALQMNASW